MTKCLTLEFSLTPKFFIADDYDAYLKNSNVKGNNGGEKIPRNFF